MRENFRAAIRNISRHGDTDVLPFPIENHVFYDMEEETLDLLEDIHANFNRYYPKDRVDTDTSLIAVGYTGFRLATQIDPIWNAYLLGLVISIGAEIEKKRLPVEDHAVFSYRFRYNRDEETLFDRNVGWREFQQISIERARHSEFIVISDISDFYPRIYHHRLQNALGDVSGDKETNRRIMLLLKKITKHNVSYGLPVGGPAARILAELLLNRVDHLLRLKGIEFCRFADDYHVFAGSRAAAYSSLVFLSEILYDNEGLSLQKSKTRLMSSQEFQDVSEFGVARDTPDKDEAQARSFLSLKLRFDPYSPTAKEDYEVLREQVKKFDIERLLSREMEKSRVHPALTRRLLTALPFQDSRILSESIRLLIDNLEPTGEGVARLYPVIPNVMILIKNVLNRIDGEVRQYAYDTLRKLVNTDSLVMKLPANLCYALRVLADDPTRETDTLLDSLSASTSITIRRDIILIMGRRRMHFWISNLKGSFTILATWEKRSLIVASFILGDEGEHWRRNIKQAMSATDELLGEWAEKRFQDTEWRIPV